MQQNSLEFWIDVNLPPVMATWIQEDFGIVAKSFKELNFDCEQDVIVFNIAAKDIDFKILSEQINIRPKNPLFKRW